MSTAIPAVTGKSHIRHALLLDIQVDETTYYISTAYNPITFDGNVYSQMGAFLSLSPLQEDLKSSNGDIVISLSGIPSGVIYSVLDAAIKGGEVLIRRAFFNDDYSLNANNVVQRYRGVITNFGITEEMNILRGELTNTVTVTAASINSVLENRITGQRTHSTDRKRLFPGDTSFDRVKDLHNTSFDFGAPYQRPPGLGDNSGGEFEDSFAERNLF